MVNFHPEDQAANQIRMFLSKVIPLRGCCYGDDETFLQGRALIDGLAVAHDMNAEHQWDLTEMAAVVYFLNSIEPVKKGVCFCDGGILSCGHQAILDAVYDNLQRITAESRKRKRAA
jgi:hypothetical protein